MKLKDLLEKYRAFRANKGYTCDICEKEIFGYPQPRVCENCEEELNRDRRKSCPVCGRKLVSEGVCNLCKSFRPTFARGISVFAYEGLAASAVNRLKTGKSYLSYYLAERMDEAFRSVLGGEWDRENAVIVCVPLTEDAYKRRGYNQSEELAKRLSERTSVPFLTDAVLKNRATKPQKRAKGKERERNVQGAYFVHSRKAVRGKTVLVVDDIMTTGATGNEMARILYAAGAKTVYFLTATAAPERK